MKLLQVLYLFAGIGVSSLAVFVYSKNRSSPVNRSLAGFAAVVSVWLMGSFMAFFDQSSERSLLWYKVSYTGIVFIPSTVFDFAINFIKLVKAKKALLAKTVCYMFSAFFALSLWTGDSFISGLHRYVWGYYPRASSLHPYFLTGFILIITSMYYIFGIGLIRLRKLNPSDPQLKRIAYALLALAVSNFAAIDFFSNYGIHIIPIGFVFMTGMVAIFAYAIVRHQLLDIEVVIRRTAVFAGLFAFVYATFTTLTILGREFFQARIGWNEWAALIPTVIVITFSLRPLETFLTNATEKFLFQKKYDYRELLKTFTNEILTVLDLQKLTEQTIAGLVKIIKLESACILLWDKDNKIFRAFASSGIKEKNITFNETDTLVQYLKATHNPILKDKEADKIHGDGHLKEDFKKLNALLCLPISLHDDLVGILALGMKKSGEDYTQEDIDILTTLARTEAIAISNAQLFDELSKTQAEAAQREKMAVIGTLAAGINHEICNPLGIVRGHCEMFLLNSRDGFYKEKSREEILNISSEIMSKVIKETDRATGITKKLSSFAKPSRRSEFEEVTIEKEVVEVLGLIQHDLEINNIDIQRDFPNNFPAIFADRKQIQQVLFNIIRNAAQAIEGKRGRILISGFSENGSAVVRISDNGMGIPQEKIGQIFNPFYTTKAPGKGTGLGLFIVKQVIERNKGTIALESHEGVGTTFTLRFPVSSDSMALHN